MAPGVHCLLVFPTAFSCLFVFFRLVWEDELIFSVVFVVVEERVEVDAHVRPRSALP